MVKKESAKRGYMTQEEVKKHLTKYESKYLEKCNFDSGYAGGIEYLTKVLKHKKLLSPKTKEVIYDALRKAYDGAAEDYDRAAEQRKRQIDHDAQYNTWGGNTAMQTYVRQHEESQVEILRGRGRAMRKKAESLKDEIRSQHQNLVSRVSSVIAIIGVLGGISFLSSNLTGNAIADLTAKSTSFLGAGLLIIGLIAGFSWLKNRKK